MHRHTCARRCTNERTHLERRVQSSKNLARTPLCCHYPGRRTPTVCPRCWADCQPARVTPADNLSNGHALVLLRDKRAAAWKTTERSETPTMTQKLTLYVPACVVCGTRASGHAAPSPPLRLHPAPSYTLATQCPPAHTRKQQKGVKSPRRCTRAVPLQGRRRQPREAPGMQGLIISLGTLTLNRYAVAFIKISLTVPVAHARR
jgi:hypothetical protein